MNIKRTSSEDLIDILNVLECAEFSNQVEIKINQIKNELDVRKMNSEFDAVKPEVVRVNYSGQMMDMNTGEVFPLDHAGNPIRQETI